MIDDISEYAVDQFGECDECGGQLIACGETQTDQNGVPIRIEEWYECQSCGTTSPPSELADLNR